MTQLLVPSLADEHVRLRPWRQTDVPAQLQAFGDPWFQRFSDWAPRTEADARAYLAEHEHARQRGEQLELALVEPHDDDVVLGGGSLNNVNLEQGRATIGYWLAPHARTSRSRARATTR
jgi:RimJ/RimL family protein N-acetyltransferase